MVITITLRYAANEGGLDQALGSVKSPPCSSNKNVCTADTDGTSMDTILSQMNAFHIIGRCSVRYILILFSHIDGFFYRFYCQIILAFLFYSMQCLLSTGQDLANANIQNICWYLETFFFPMARQPLLGQRLLWSSDQPVAEISI
jgi:hypothetical protein